MEPDGVKADKINLKDIEAPGVPIAEPKEPAPTPSSEAVGVPTPQKADVGIDEFSAAILNPEPPQPKTVEEKLEEARLAMAGPELAAKMDVESHKRALKAEQITIKTRLDEIAKLKERHELDWVNLDEARTKIKTTLSPLNDKEDKIETEEKELEAQENTIPTPKERRVVEEKLWQVEDSRRTTEKEKWVIEAELIKTEDKITTETAEYRKILDEEDTLFKRLDAIDAELES